MIMPKGDFFCICCEENKTIIAVEEIGIPPDGQVQID